MDVTDELTDRYGDIPDEAMQLINVAEIRAHAGFIGAVSISRSENRIIIRFSDKVKLHPYVFVMARSEYGEDLAISDGRATMMQLRTGRTAGTDRLLGLMRYLRAAKEEALTLEKASS